MKDVPVQRYPEPAVRRFVDAFIRALGGDGNEAEIVADGLTTACLWWHPGQHQGLEKLFRYHRRVGNGGIVPRAEMKWVREGPSHALLDAAKGFGYVGARRAMDRAVEMAREGGVGFVGVRHSNHFGIAGYHAHHAASRGFIGWSMTNAGAEMAPTGSAKPTLGTNPWGIAIPRKDDPPVVLDMALTMSGKGMMRWFEREGLEIPASWALTPDGQRTTSPTEAMAGALLPIGEYKGFGLSLLTDILAGVMTGSLFGLDVFQDDRNFDVGHVLVAIDPAVFLDRQDFDRRLEELLAQVKAAPPIDANVPVMLPGETELARKAERLRNGIPADAETVPRLKRLAEELGVVFPDEVG